MGVGCKLFVLFYIFRLEINVKMMISWFILLFDWVLFIYKLNSYLYLVCVHVFVCLCIFCMID